jgi:hypothetical protein
MNSILKVQVRPPVLSPDELRELDAWWRAANYLSVGQIFLFDNPLLKRPLVLADVKRMLLGHWGTTPGQNFIYAHLNRVIVKYDLDMFFISGPGHGGPAVVANTYLEGTYTEIYPEITQDEAGLQKLFLQFSFPGGIPSHASPECPGSIHEGGELGYSLSHAFGAAFDNPELIVACVIGTVRPRPGRSQRRGIPTSFSIRAPMARCCRSASQQLQDRQSHLVSPHLARRARAAAARLRLDALLRERSRTRAHARGDGEDTRCLRGTYPRCPARSAPARALRTPALADDRVGVPQRLDRT